MSTRTPLVIFSDLDGTLLDHDTYRFDAAQPALDRLRHHAIPVVLASSKTAAELQRLQGAMRICAYPAIVENGAGVIGLGAAATRATEYEALRAHLDSLPEGLRAGFTGFGDMTSDEVAKLTGLPMNEAALARDRHFSEPGLWSGSAEDKAEFLAALEMKGVQAREGGRFLTLSFGRTKASRMAQVARLYQPDATIALGDAPNDVEMLEAADYGFIIRNPHRPALPELAGEAEGRIKRTETPGPQGWNTAIHSMLDQWNLD